MSSILPGLPCVSTAPEGGIIESSLIPGRTAKAGDNEDTASKKEGLTCDIVKAYPQLNTRNGAPYPNA